MKILFVCQHYAPYVSGVSKVVQEYTKYLKNASHSITVATTKFNYKKEEVIDDIQVVRFKIKGNYVTGIKGEVKEYQEFIKNGEFDIVFSYAAQQWSFDCLMPVAHELKAKLVHVPCGYSSLFDKRYDNYFEDVLRTLREFDLILFHAEKYRDIDYIKSSGLRNFKILPNGASESEFSTCPNELIKGELGIGEKDTVLLTVGSPPGLKGHKELLRSYSKLKIYSPSTLVINGKYDLSFSIKNIIKYLISKSDRQIFNYAKKINKMDNKRVMVTDLKREDLVSLYFKSDLFILPSAVEYSPLVLFEAAASGLPFLSNAVGNAKEIANWTGGGDIYYVRQDKRGRARVDTEFLASKIKEMIMNKEKLELYSKKGRANWEKGFKWSLIGEKLEAMLSEL